VRETKRARNDEWARYDCTAGAKQCVVCAPGMFFLLFVLSINDLFSLGYK
jgi:hypothetical protein